MAIRTRVLCVSSERWLSAATVPRLLQLAGAHVSFLGPKDAWPMRSGVIDCWIDADGGPDAVARVLCDHLQSAEPYAWVLACDDLLLAAIARRSDEPWARAILPMPVDDTRVGLLGSKLGFVRATQALGLPSPWFRICEGMLEIRSAMLELGAAVMIKEDGPSGGEGCHLVEDVAHLAKLPGSVLCAPVVVQAFVRGQAHSVEALFDHGHVRSVLTSRLLKAWPTQFGPSSQRRFKHDARLVAFTEDIGRKVGLHGFANITIIEDARDAQLMLVELDPRPNMAFHLGDALGVRMTSALRALLEQHPHEPMRHLSPTLDMHVFMYPNDVLRCAQQRDWLGMLAWLTDFDGRWRWIPQGDARLTASLRDHIARQVLRMMVPAETRRTLTQLRARFAG